MCCILLEECHCCKQCHGYLGKISAKSKDCYESEQCNGTYQGSSLRAPPPRGEASQ